MTTPIEVLEEWESLPVERRNSRTAKQYAKKVGMRSMGEVRCAAALDRMGIQWEYEPEKWTYQYKPQKYTPDFKCVDHNIYIEYKGKMTNETRKKLLAIKMCNPNKILYMVFERPKNFIRKGSKTTYGDWCEQHGIEWSDQLPKEEWFNGS